MYDPNPYQLTAEQKAAALANAEAMLERFGKHMTTIQRVEEVIRWIETTRPVPWAETIVKKLKEALYE
jgi:hypothetical protein